MVINLLRTGNSSEWGKMDSKRRRINNEYDLLKVIGCGTFAQQVVLANHGDDHLVVIKSLEKMNLKKRNQIQHTINEKHVLETLNHPFVVKILNTFQTTFGVHIVLEYCAGGELFYHMQQKKYACFNEEYCTFYISEVLCGIEYLHDNGILYRDLKPENVLLDEFGHVKLADFGFCKPDMNSSKRTYSFCGSPEYLSPEMIRKTGHSMSTDIWSFGCFCYELFVGHPPFPLHDNLQLLFTNICKENIQYPDHLSKKVIQFLKFILQKDATKRPTAHQIMQHSFFQNIDWDFVYDKKLRPPIIPIQNNNLQDVQNFDTSFTQQNPIPLHQLFHTSNPQSTFQDQFLSF